MGASAAGFWVCYATVAHRSLLLMLLREDLPQDLLATAEAATAWVNTERGSEFTLTGLADAPVSGESGDQMALVLCDGELCAREDLRVRSPQSEGLQFEFLEAPKDGIPPLLDPPVGVRAGWLEAQLEKFEFVLLLFYRGRW